jgi:hypothetical protein
MKPHYLESRLEHHVVDLEKLLYKTVDRDALELSAHIIRAINDKNPPYVIFSVLWEPLTEECGTMSRFVGFLRQIIDAVNTRCYLICNSWYRPYQDLFRTTKVQDTLFLDIVLMYLYQQWIKDLDAGPRWNPDSTKFLFLSHRPQIHRMRLLYKFYQSRLLDRAEWSCHIQGNAGRQWLPELSQTEYEEFVQMVHRKPDPEFNSESIIGGLLLSPSQECSLYANRLFQVVNETHFDNLRLDNAWITEKTWKAMLNRLPFIMAGNQFTLYKLKNMGFQTFENFMLIPNVDEPDTPTYLRSKQGHIIYRMPDSEWQAMYNTVAAEHWPDCPTHEHVKNLPQEIQDEINARLVIPIRSDTEMRLDAIVQNTEHWLETLAAQRHEVQNAIEHNFQRCMQLGKENFDKFDYFLSENDIALSWQALKKY